MTTAKKRPYPTKERHLYLVLCTTDVTSNDLYHAIMFGSLPSLADLEECFGDDQILAWQDHDTVYCAWIFWDKDKEYILARDRGVFAYSEALRVRWM